MTPGQRKWAFLVGMAGLMALIGWAIAGLPGFGSYPGPYGPAIVRHAVAQTNATGVVSAINFEYRGFDTVGEEFILVTAVAGMSVVLRRLRGEKERPAAREDLSGDRPPTSEAVRAAGLVLVGPTVVAGWWLATHAQTNPSGGFQGGVLLATAFALVYLSGEFLAFRRISLTGVTEAAEALGAGGFAAVGVTALILGLPYLDPAGPLLQGGGLMRYFPFLVAAWILACGLYGLITSRDLIRQIICLIVVQSSTYVMLLGVGYVTGGIAPYFSDIPGPRVMVDPVVQALALTDVVVEAAVTALLVSFAIQAHKRFGTLDPHDLAEFKG
jgi:multisubunit Na+/H+ antiporter MnhC subunit